MGVNADNGISCVVSSVVRYRLYSIICIIFGEKQMTSVRLLVIKVENVYVIFYDITKYILLSYFK